MRELTGKTAFVTGGASGIGLALGRAFAEAGMKGMLGGIEKDALATRPENLVWGGFCEGVGPRVLSVSFFVRPESTVSSPRPHGSSGRRAQERSRMAR